MSRSYKKNPVGTCTKNPIGKKQANKKVRNTNYIPEGNAFKKIYCSWNICDYKYDWRSWFTGKERASKKGIDEYNKIIRK